MNGLTIHGDRLISYLKTYFFRRHICRQLSDEKSFLGTDSDNSHFFGSEHFGVDFKFLFLPVSTDCQIHQPTSLSSLSPTGDDAVLDIHEIFHR